MPALLLPLFPAIITYAIIRHRLWDIRTVMHKTAAWLLLSVLIALPLSLLMWLVVKHFPPLSVLEQAAGLTILFWLGYLYIRAVQPKVNRLFQRGAYDRMQVADQFSRVMTGLSTPDQIMEQLRDTLNQTIFPECITTYVRADDEMGWQKFFWPETMGRKTPVLVNVEHPFIFRLLELGKAVERSQLEIDPAYADIREASEKFLSPDWAVVCAPLVVGPRLLGLVFLGQKQNLKPYSRDDLEFIERLCAEASMGLSNALLFERVDRQRRDLIELNATLEQRVLDRTRELQEVNQKLSKAYEALRELDVAKSRFFANVSHDLRTPLTLILAPIESILDEGGPAMDGSLKEQLSGVYGSALSLYRLIDDILELSRLEESHLKLRLDRVDLAALCQRLVDFARPLASRKQVEIELSAPVELVVEADEYKLERVLVNLLGNALKFTEPGGRVKVLAEKREERALVEVSDTGIGISEEDCLHVFERFRQVDSSITKKQGGSGIGLALVKELIELHGGRAELKSVLGEGSVFTIVLPMDASQLPQERIEKRAGDHDGPSLSLESRGLADWNEEILSRPEYRFMGLDKATDRRVVARSPGEDVKGVRALVADDNPEILQFLYNILSDRFDVWPVQDGKRAWELLQETRFDLVIADIMMPQMDGLELCRRIKAEPKIQQTPVILLTARGGADYRIEGHGVGADHYLTKPFRPAELNAVIKNLLAGRLRLVEGAARRHSESLETLLAGMAHELRNACHQVQSSQSTIWQLAKQLLMPGPDAATPTPDADNRLQRMEAISKRAVERITTVVNSLQQYVTHHMQMPWSEQNLDELVEQETRLVTSADQKNVALELLLKSQARVYGPVEGLRQLVLNLVDNAVGAVSPGGWVRVETCVEGGRVKLKISDNGHGIPKELQDRVFDPFFTTKEPGKGMGLGLALCKRTATDMDGSIQVLSEVGKGTQMIVDLPMVVKADNSKPRTLGETPPGENHAKNDTVG